MMGLRKSFFCGVWDRKQILKKKKLNRVSNVFFFFFFFFLFIIIIYIIWREKTGERRGCLVSHTQ